VVLFAIIMIINLNNCMEKQIEEFLRKPGLFFFVKLKEWVRKM